MKSDKARNISSQTIRQVDNSKTKAKSKIITSSRLPGLTLVIFTQLLAHSVFLSDERLLKCVYFQFHPPKKRVKQVACLPVSCPVRLCCNVATFQDLENKTTVSTK